MNQKAMEIAKQITEDGIDAAAEDFLRDALEARDLDLWDTHPTLAARLAASKLDALYQAQCAAGAYDVVPVFQ